jgi:DNA-binding response OmpR family regulator
MNERILLIEDEEAIAIPLADRLRGEGYSVEIASEGMAGYQEACRGTYDLILLDVMLPGRSGLDVCRDLRRNGIATPIVMLTARSETYDKVVGLKLGADDYIPKPFEIPELLARIEAVLRRAAAPRLAGDIHQFGDLRVDLRRAVVSCAGRPIPLSAREFQLLRYLIEHPDTILSRQQLLRDVWDFDPGISTRTVDVHIGWLRQKLERNPKNPRLIVTATGLGYRFTGCV